MTQTEGSHDPAKVVFIELFVKPPPRTSHSVLQAAAVAGAVAGDNGEVIIYYFCQDLAWPGSQQEEEDPPNIVCNVAMLPRPSPQTHPHTVLQGVTPS